MPYQVLVYFDVWRCVQHTYGLLMDAYASIDDLSGCQRVLESMASDSIVPNAVIWNAFLKARMASPQTSLEVCLPTLSAMRCVKHIFTRQTSMTI